MFNEIPDKVVLKKILSNGGVEQAALLSKSKAGRPTLDCVRIWLSQTCHLEACGLGAGSNGTRALD